MIVARIVVGIVALLIALAGLGWFAVDLFGSSGRPPRPADGGSSPAASDRPRSPAGVRFRQRQRRRTIGLGVGAVVAGLILIPEALTAIRTDTPMPMPHGPAIEGHVALAMFVSVIVLGVALIGVGVRDR
jgi:hypothetical protein